MDTGIEGRDLEDLTLSHSRNFGEPRMAIWSVWQARNTAAIPCS